MTPRPVALVTGGSSGIGAALAPVLAQAGHDLVLVARGADELERVADPLRATGTAVEVLPADLSTPAGTAPVGDRLGHGDVRVLVSNAGAGGYAPLAEVDAEDAQRLWHLNATVPVTLTRAALPHLLAAGTGGVMTVSSLLAFSGGLGVSPLPPRTLYVAAKAATVAFTRTLRAELEGTGVTATVVCPGIVSTAFNHGRNASAPTAMSAADVAHAAWAGFSRGEELCVPGLDAPSRLVELADVEAALFSAGNRRELAERYRSATS